MKNSFRISIVFLMLISSLAKAEVKASLDRDEVGAGESVELTLARDSHGGDAPDLGPLKKDFDILGSSRGSSIQIVNGHFSSHTELRLSLSPKHSGTLEIPSLNWGGEQTAPVQLTVTDSTSGTSGSAANGATTTGSSHIFITGTLDQKQPYVQGAVVLTIAVHADQPFQQASLDFSGNSDVSVQVLDNDVRSTEIRDGHRFEVIERKYLLLPQRSGEISLPGPTFDAQVADLNARDPFANDSFFGRAFGGMPGMAGMLNATRPLRLHGEDLRLDVRPRPASVAGNDWLPAKHVTLEEDWKPNDAHIAAGEPLTLHLHLNAEGLSAAQLPDLSARLALPDGIKAYPDQPKLDTSLKSGELLGSRDQDIALIAAQGGRYRIPPIKLSWWDITQNAAREIVLPEHTIDVPAGAIPPPINDAASAPPANANAPASSLEPDAKPAAKNSAKTSLRSPWMWVSLVLGLLWLGSLAILWRRRRAAIAVAVTAKIAPVASARSDQARAGDACRAFQQACRDNDPQSARQALLGWAKNNWGAPAPAGLNALARRLDDPRITPLLQGLDRACYSGASWIGEPLSRALTTLPNQRKPVAATNSLASLYGPGG